jgi:hypothetical protein
MGEIWKDLGISREAWYSLAAGFYALAHSDRRAFDALPPDLKEHPAGQLCCSFLETNNRAFLDRAGLMLCGTKDWYVYLGRCM